MSSTEEPNSQLDQLRIEKSLLDIKIKEKRSELSLMEDGKADPRYLTTKTDILFLTERRNLVRVKTRYREDNNKDNVRIYKSPKVGVKIVINELEEERKGLGLEITELRGLIATEQKKKKSSKGDVTISHMEDRLVDLKSRRKKVTEKIGYHRRKLKKSQARLGGDLKK